MRLPCRGPEGLKAAFIFSSPLNPAQKAMLMRRQAADRAQWPTRLKAAADRTKAQAASPESSESFLRTGPGITGSVSIPARAALELHQTGMDIFEPLGWAEQDAADTGAMGQELEVFLFRLIRGWTLRRSTP